MEIIESRKVLNVRTMNQNIVKIEYAIIDPVYLRTCEIAEELKQGIAKPFENLITVNFGDCQAQGQKPITFVREILALVSYPDLLNDPNFSHDCKEHARRLLAECYGNSVGAYTATEGINLIRDGISKFIENRDKFPCNRDNIYITNGASEAVDYFLCIVPSNTDRPNGVMIPVPQYPLYSATVAKHRLFQIEYYLEEKENWSLNLNELQRSINASRQFCHPRCIVVINPGNPTGQVLTRENIEVVIKFAYNENLIILADEVYQFNVYGKNQFHSFKKVMCEMGPPYCKTELVSVMSVSKGYTSECGIRGGYCELFNFDPEVEYHFSKCLSARTNCSVYGQIVMYTLVNPPKPEDASYMKHEKEKMDILKSLEEKAALCEARFNLLKGIKCNQIQGAMYAFPSIYLPERAILAATEKKLTPDQFYAMELLESTGIAIIPGNGFVVKKGTYHFRVTIIPTYAQLLDMFQKWEIFHKNFMALYE